MVLDSDGDVVLVLDLKEPVSEVVVDAESTDSPEHEMSADAPSEDVIDTTSADSPFKPSTVSTSPTTEPKKIRFVVSSRHMMLASPVFKAMLRGSFQEGLKLKEAGKVEIPLPDDDCAAWNILLNIIHGRYMAIPLQLKLQVMTQIAVLVDKYRMHEVVYLFLPTWRKAMDYPPTRWEDIISWICISWVFELREEFRELTKKVQLDCDKTFESTIKLIDASRREAMENAFNVLEKTISQYENQIPNCDTFHQTLIASINSAGDELVGLLLGLIKVDEMKPQCPTQ
ncbi:hypothetical protein SS1G_09797 [Sclerotinia sclerotiorum 1980 UF-70]|uniref:BTB domain-containing protein n=1 Tax=Sclerotinia sclerotiorum (strain ATCC 18683 / 1980 / Ss-1) TaxID=665079 RepID=A7EWT8_SCLS1|nr:hypothetical protein SS1G_09797 [Sclerotinia sclerotiorum 1980 UF-70]EDN93930.1 hypothetical protein SS1G_09797 [Sclerotinia sclerotiorum 1980 UF-70]